jgi:hypothetical protein
VIGQKPMYFLIGRFVNWLTQRLTRPVFRGFFRAVKAFPPLFSIVAGGGLGVGCWLTWLLHDPDPTRQLLIRLAGIICLGFYGWLEAVFIFKAWTGGWGEFCDRCQQLIDEQS